MTTPAVANPSLAGAWVASRSVATPSVIAAKVLARLEAAWNAADGAAFGREYAPDASFVTIRGEHIVGADAIAAGHAGIFATIYAGSVSRMELVGATPLSGEVLVVVSRNTLDCPTGPLVGIHQAMSTSVVVRDPGHAHGWAVAFTHNTLVAA